MRKFDIPDLPLEKHGLNGYNLYAIRHRGIFH
jgi:hypothetical protein